MFNLYRNVHNSFLYLRMFIQIGLLRSQIARYTALTIIWPGVMSDCDQTVQVIYGRSWRAGIVWSITGKYRERYDSYKGKNSTVLLV